MPTRDTPLTGAGKVATLVAVAAVALSLGAPARAAEQSTRAEQIEQQKAQKVTAVRPPVRDTGDDVVVKVERVVKPVLPAFKPLLGGFRANAGFGAGASYVTPAGRHALWTTSAAWSIHNFKAAGTALELPGVLGGRTDVRATAKWLDEPTLTFYGVGLAAPAGEKTNYGLRTTDVSLGITTRAGRWFNYGADLGLVDTRSRDVALSTEARTLLASEIPGFGVDVTWTRAGAFAAVDTRQSPGYTDRGGLYSASWRGYHDRGGRFSFARTDLDIRQFVPILHGNWILALQAKAQVATPATGNVVPYFMLPAIGGRDTLPGFDDYRFADRASLLLRSELRWTPSPVIDMALLLDHGTVAPRLRDVSVGGLQRAWGVGMRLHSSTSTVLRFEIAHSIEGWRYNLAQGVSF